MPKPTSVRFLGIASVTPEAGTDTASYLVNDGELMIDTGWYGAIQMLQFGVSPNDIEVLFLTHCHHDHYIGLPHLLFYPTMRQPDRPPLHIVGPAADIAHVVRRARDFLQEDRFAAVRSNAEVVPLQPGDSFETENFRIDTVPAIHAVQGFCSRFTDLRTGSTFAFSGDTGFNPAFAELARGAQLMIHEASCGLTDPGPEAGHSSARQAAATARDAGVARLALVHGPASVRAAAVAAAREIMPDTFWPETGERVELEPQPRQVILCRGHGAFRGTGPSPTI